MSMSKSVVTLAVSALLAAGAIGGAVRLHAAAADESAAGAVKVTIDYKGKGTVDGSHRVWVWLFDTPDIGPGAMPIAQMAVEKNGDVAVFDVSNEKVWIAVAYDEKGMMGGDGPPPSGTPIGIYSMGTGAPEAVTAGAQGAVVVTFDDSLRMP
jgi:hypothetical protein